MKKNSIVILLFFFMLLSAGSLFAEEKEGEVNTGQDFTKPLTRFDIRFKYQDLSDGYETSILTLRADKPFVIGGGWQLYLRADLPYMWSDVPSKDNPPPGKNQDGLADSLVQVLVITPTYGKWTAGFGTQVVFPTADKAQMGSGKYLLLPTAGVKYDLEDWMKGAWAAFLVRHAVDIASDDDDSPYVNQTYIQPILNIMLPKLWFLTFAPESRYDWRTENWHVPFDVLFGKMITRKIVASVEYKTAIVDDLPLYEQEVEFRIGFFF